MFDIMFMRQKRNETAWLIWIARFRSAFFFVFFFLELKSRCIYSGWDGHASTKQRCEIQYEALAFMI